MIAPHQAEAASQAAWQASDMLLRDLWQILLIPPRGAYLLVCPAEAAILFIPIGLVFLLFGFRLYKWLVMVVYAGIGSIVGLAVAAYLGWSALLVMMAGSIVLGLLAWPLHRIGWGLLGGVLLGGLAALLVRGRTENVVLIVGAAVIAFAAGLVLAMMLLRPLITGITSLIGAGLLVQGAVALAMLIKPSVGGPIASFLEARWYALAAVVGVLAILGFALQWHEGEPAGAKRSKSPSEKQADEDDG